MTQQATVIALMTICSCLGACKNTATFLCSSQLSRNEFYDPISMIRHFAITKARLHHNGPTLILGNQSVYWTDNSIELPLVIYKSKDVLYFDNRRKV
jgi:hypothetical protein